MRIAIIWPYYPPELGAASNRGASLAGYLASVGHEIILCAPRPSYLVTKTEGPPPAVEVTRRIPTRLRSTSRSRVVRIIREIAGGLAIPASIWRSVREADVVIVSSPPLLFGLAGVLTTRAARRPVLFDIRDLWPDVILESGEVRAGFLTRLASRAALLGYQSATAIAVVSLGSRAKLLRMGIDPEKIIVIPNGVDEALVHPDPDQNGAGFSEVHEIAAKTRNTDRAQFRIVYSGLLGPAQGVAVLLDAMRQTGMPIRADLVGDGSQADQLREAADGANFEVRFHGLVSRREALMIAAESDAAFVPLASSAMSDTIPSKLFEAMAIGLPVLAATSGEAADIVVDAEAGLVSEPRDPDQLATNIIRLARDRSLGHRMGLAGQHYVGENFVREKIFSGVVDELDQIAGRRAP